MLHELDPALFPQLYPNKRLPDLLSSDRQDVESACGQSALARQHMHTSVSL